MSQTPQEILDESIVLNSLSLRQIVHPEHGELVVIVENDGESDIPNGDKLKIIEMAKIFIVKDILDSTRTIE